MNNKAKEILKREWLQTLDDHGIPTTKFSELHFRAGAFDFWPTSGKFLNRETRVQGRGVTDMVRAFNEYVPDLEVARARLGPETSAKWRKFFGPKTRRVSSFGPRGQHVKSRTRGY